MEKRVNKKRNTPQYYDVIIVGTGIAGVFTALSIEKDVRILMITKERLDRSTSHLAQGGIASPIFGKHLYEDTLRAGGYVNDPGRVRILVEEGSKQIDKLINWGVPFDRDAEGKLSATREGGHTERNILHCKDATGKKMMTALEAELHKKENLRILEKTYVYQLSAFSENTISSLEKAEGDRMEAESGGVVSAILPDGQSQDFISPNIVIATGGIGGLYETTSNPKGNTGDGMALGKTLGLDLKDLEFNQFHPTYFYGKNRTEEQNRPGESDGSEEKDRSGFLVTEALRGEGAVLRNAEGVAFMKKHHPMGDLAPRDVVARGIYEELQKGSKANVTVDISHRGEAFIKNRFPKIYRKALEQGYDITREPLPVRPASHYMMGGIAVNDFGETTLPGIYAVGECACTGVHGANRLASNSLLEAIVFAGRVAEKISSGYPKAYQKGPGIARHERDQEVLADCKQSTDQTEPSDFSWSYKELSAFRQALKKETQKVLGIIKNDRLLEEFRSDLVLAVRLFEEKAPPESWSSKKKRVFYEVKNHLILANTVTKAALNRAENIGAHYKVTDKKQNKETGKNVG